MTPTLQNVRRYLSRESSSGAFIPEIDGLRLVAILAVIFHHLAGFLLVKTGHTGPRGLLADLCARGNYGVQLFFVISGFVIACPFARAALERKPAPQIKRYYLRRLTRLEPPYMLNLLVAFVLLVITGRAAFSELLPHLIASLTYTHNVIYGEFSAVNCVAWSLEIELQFYLVAPILACLFRLQSGMLRRSVMVLLILGASLFGQFAPRDLPRLGLSLAPFLGYFLGGFVLCDLHTQGWLGASTRRWLWDGVGVAAWCAIVALMWTRWAFLLPLVVVLAYVGAFRGRVLRACFTHPLVYTIGGMCYTIYLYHFFMISALGRFALGPVTALASDATVRLALMSLALVPVVLLCCAVLFALTERPFMVRDWPQKAWRFAALRIGGCAAHSSP